MNKVTNKINPVITIIIAVYNGDKTLEQCINSVLNQSYRNVQLIIIDGNSTDKTIDIIRSNQSAINYWVSEKDAGIYNAWNKGLMQAKGDWVVFLGADDYLLDNNVLNNVVEQLKNRLIDTFVAYGPVMLVNIKNERIYTIGRPWEKIRSSFKQTMCIPHQGVFHSRQLFEKYGRFDESFQIAGDYELLLRYLKEHNAVFMPDIVITGMRQGGASTDAKNVLQVFHEYRKAQLKNGIKIFGQVWMVSLIKVYLRIALWRILGEKNAKYVFDKGRGIFGMKPYWTRL